MINLSKHIEALLLNNDCVIVPGLGGFVTQSVPARYVTEEQLFLPPHRTIGFNPQLTLNDGLLVQSYMQAYGTGYSEATLQIEETVYQLKETLHASGEFTLDGIGTFTLDLSDALNFHPIEAGVISPQLYGLGSFIVSRATAAHSSSVADSVAEEQEEKRVKVVTTSATSRTYTLNFNRELCNYAAAVAVAIIFYFLWATPVGVADSAYTASPAIATTQLGLATASAPQPSATHRQLGNKAVPATPGLQDGSPASTSKQQQAQGRYTIVVASSVPRKGAMQLVEQLNQDGLANAEIIEMKRMVRVVYGHYTTAGDAQAALRTLRQGVHFKEAWVMEIGD